jgi:peptide/nickel transport system ATP-binding protein
VLQDPKFSLNPGLTVGDQIGETWRAHHGGNRSAARRRALDLLAQVQIRDPERVAAYTHQLSGGTGQRVMIALVLAPGPKLLIAEEPASALDATVQAEILRFIDGLVSRLGMGLQLIGHGRRSIPTRAACWCAVPRQSAATADRARRAIRTVTRSGTQ